MTVTVKKSNGMLLFHKYYSNKFIALQVASFYVAMGYIVRSNDV